MIATCDRDSVTLDPIYQSPANMMDVATSSAFSLQSAIALPDFVVYGSHGSRDRNEHTSMFGQTFQSIDLGSGLVRVVSLIDPAEVFALELGNKAKKAAADQRAWRSRIQELRVEAELDGYRLNVASERDFWKFIRVEPFIRKGSLVLLDNGNLRAMWKGQNGSQIGLQFLGGRVVQYVIFKHRPDARTISRVAGRDSFDGVRRQIAAFDLHSLMYA